MTRLLPVQRIDRGWELSADGAKAPIAAKSRIQLASMLFVSPRDLRKTLHYNTIPAVLLWRASICRKTLHAAWVWRVGATCRATIQWLPGRSNHSSKAL